MKQLTRITLILIMCFSLMGCSFNTSAVTVPPVTSDNAENATGISPASYYVEPVIYETVTVVDGVKYNIPKYWKDYDDGYSGFDITYYFDDNPYGREEEGVALSLDRFPEPEEELSENDRLVYIVNYFLDALSQVSDEFYLVSSEHNVSTSFEPINGRKSALLKYADSSIVLEICIIPITESKAFLLLHYGYYCETMRHTEEFLNICNSVTVDESMLRKTTSN